MLAMIRRLNGMRFASSSSPKCKPATTSTFVQQPLKIDLQDFHDINDLGKIKPSSQWKFWVPCTQFVRLHHVPHLGVNKIDKKLLLPAERTFLALPEMDDKYVHADNDEKYSADIENAIVAQGVDPCQWHTSVHEANERLIKAINRACEAESSQDEQPNSQPRTKAKINFLAMFLAQMCGLNDAPLEITGASLKFKMAGLKCSAFPDVFQVVETKSKDSIILIFEDKVGAFRDHGFMGQIAAELLMSHYTNLHSGSRPERVYCLRVFQHYVTLLAMEIKNPQLILDVCEAGLVPQPMIDLLSDVADPTVAANGGKGYDLMKKKDREHVVMLIASIRQSMINKNNR